MKNYEFLSIIIVVYNSAKFIETTIQSVIKHLKNVDFEIIVVDNNSTDDTVARVERIGAANIKIIANNNNYGFAKANNLGFKNCNGDYILILNPDIEFVCDTDIKLLLGIIPSAKTGD